MIVRDENKMHGTERSVSAEQWTSVRMLLADDAMGFSFHITHIKAGSVHTFHYKNHFESVYCIKGKGRIEDIATGEVHEIEPGVMYALDKHDKHTLTCDEDFVFACCFNPPVTGNEVHREDGSYAAPDEAA
ncbi:ectoine synthase [Roseivivax halodurans JCM 10272]|uniref:L-ectoine synthase n=1 Tax=Roseivivax halodurans JCM 10272 TaxID=1449350 RepID=X7EDN4_9RHOB|nr:ectoine synthase [Roseivivax halodurans]ETX13970.1 ectoine synthase [Roseivivax halodurans JCM 10272]